MTTAQTQVTGPVDDAIDTEVDRLIDCAQTWAMNVERGNTITACTDKDEAVRLARSISRRLAPRADALIEREQIQSAINNGIANAYADFVDAWEPHVYPDGLTFDGRLEAIRDAIDAELALLPRAPMPDVVTISRQDAVFAVNQLRQFSRNERGLMYTDFLADRIEIAIALTPTETTDPAMEGE